MDFKVKDTGKVATVELNRWHHGFNAGWDIDESQDLMASAVDGLELDDDGNYLISQAELDELIDWWQDEVNKANADPYEYCGDGLTGTRYGYNPEDCVNDPDPDEWHLSIDYRDDEQQSHCDNEERSLSAK